MRWPSLLEIDMDRFRYAPDDIARSDAQDLSDLVAAGAFRAAVARFQDAVSFRPFNLLPEANYAAFAKYCAAVAAAQNGDVAAARGFMAAVDIPLSGDFDLLPYAEAVAYGHEMRRRQLECISEGRPGIYVASLPKSASGFLSNTLASILGVPIARTAMVCRPGPATLDYFVVDAWAKCVAQGGCVTHEHTSASHGNPERLAEAGIRKIIVQIRDPRASTASLYHHFFGTEPKAEYARSFKEFAAEYYGHLAGWVDGWLCYADQVEKAIEVRIVTYDAIRAEAADAIAGAIGFATGLDRRDAVDDHLNDRAARGELPHNFRKGEPENWRGMADSDLIEWFWGNTPGRVRSYLAMTK